MTFGHVKSQIDYSLLESYKNEDQFKKTVREFRENILKNKKLSTLYSIYEQLSKPQGLSEKDAELFLNEGLVLISKLISKVKLPKLTEEIKNNYSDLDTLVYSDKSDLLERIESKKNILSNLTKEKEKISEGIKIPISSMLKIANQTLEAFISEMKSEDRKLFLELVKKDKKNLDKDYIDLKENTLKKLNVLLVNEENEDLKKTIVETIQRLDTEKCNQFNYLKLVSLEQSL